MAAFRTTRNDPDTVVLMKQAAGIALIPKPTPLTRLNYFDGKFLRAADLQAEQEYHRRLQQMATSAGGSGVVHGFDLQLLAGDQVELSAGLALDASGRVLHLPMEAAVQVEELLRRSRGDTVVLAGGARGSAVFTLCEVAAVTAVTPVVAGTSLYVLGLTHAEALCGQEDVFGKPCESVCASGTERPQRLEGVVLRALPLQLATPLPSSNAEVMQTLHLRSRVASAWFADEARQVESLISGTGLLSSLWCRGAAASTGDFVPLAVLARAGGHTVFIDSWTARREHMAGPPQRYWQWRMRMRPWDVFLAQVLQFQCQLRDGLTRTPNPDDDPCADLRKAVVEVGDILTQLDRQYQASSAKLAARDAASVRAAFSASEAVPISRTLLANATSAVKRAGSARGTLQLQPTDRLLIRRGIVELPAAGYLPVAPGSAFPVNEQVRRLMGDGVDLRFCVVRPDFVAHALEEAQHMQRISLLRGLDNPREKEEVDILVPDGQILSAANSQGAGWEVRLATSAKTNLIVATRTQRDVMTGAARSERQADGALIFFFAGLVETASRDAALAALKTWAGERDNGLEQTLWKSVDLQRSNLATAAAVPAKKARTASASTSASTSATATAATAEPTPQELASRFSALREEAVAYRMKALERVANTATTAGIRHFEGLKAASLGGAVAKNSDHTGLWLALKSETDPFAAAEGSRVDVSMDLSLISPKSGGTQFIDIGIVGAQLVIDSRVTSGRRQVVQGTLRGAAIIAGLVGTLANSQRGLQFSVPVIISTEPTDEGRRTNVEVDFSALLFDNRGFLGMDRLGVKVLTAQSGQLAALQVQMSAQGTDLDIVARLTRNDAVLRLGHPLRAASEAAIDVIATRESATNFATQARSDLFGQRAPQADAITVRATLDWVLFHRRRNKQCGDAPNAPVLEARRYELHHLKVKTDEQLRAARAAVLAGNAAVIRRLGFAPIGAVAFDGGRSSLQTPTAELLQDWQAADPGTRLRFGAIGSQGAAQGEGDALAQARLAGLELTLAQGELDRALENQVLPVLPALGLAGWDGAVFLITEDVVVLCHDVVALDTAALLTRFAGLVKKNGLASAMKAMQLQTLAQVNYQADGKTVETASAQALKGAWAASGSSGPPQNVALVYHGSTTVPALAQQRSSALMQVLGSPGDKVQPFAAKDLDQVTDCAGLSVIVRPAVVQARNDTVLMAFVPFDGRFIISANTQFGKHAFQDFKPADVGDFDNQLKAIAFGAQPARISIGVQARSELSPAEDVLKAVQEQMVVAGYTGIRNSNTEVLTADVIKAIEGRGFPPATWQFAVLLNNRG